MSDVKISVIVPVYKVEKYLCQCIDSILNQTLKDIEVILVDEGDLDACRAIIDMYENGVKKDSRVKAVHEKNGGYGASVNKGMDIATGEYISIIESDDFIEPAMLEEMYNYAKKLDADVVKTPYYEYWDKTLEQSEEIKNCFWFKQTNNIPQNITFKIEDNPILVAIHPSIWSALYKTSYLREKFIKCIEAKGAGYVDNHFRIQTLCQTNKITWLNKPFYYYRLSNPEASQANCDLGTFIQRWSDVHLLFDEKFPEKWDTLAPYCIIEEWRNTFNIAFYQENIFTSQMAELLINNLKKYSIEHIKISNQLNKKEKKCLLKIKKNPSSINRSNFLTYIINLLRFRIFIKSKKAEFQFMYYLKKTLLRIKIYIGNFYKINIDLGNNNLQKE